MVHSLVLSIMFYICGIFYMSFGSSVMATNAKSNANRLFLLLTSSLATWSFSHSISTSASTAEASAFWRTFSVFGWGIFSSFLLHFILVLTEGKSRLKPSVRILILYLPALINIILFGPFGFLVEKQYKMVQTDFGWMNVASTHAGTIWLNLYYVVFSLASVVLLIRWWRKIEPHTPMKRQARNFVISIMFLFFIETVVEFLPDIFEKRFFPKLAVLFLLIPTIMLFVTLKNFGLLVERGKTYSFSEIKRNLVEDRSHLFQTITTIFMLGGALSFLIGYFGRKERLEDKLLVAAALFLIGIFVRFIPLITRKHAIQNAIILAICTISLLHFMASEASTGALTIWSVYILFLLLTVILDHKIYSYAFVILSIIIQIIFGIIHPKVAVTIDKNVYATRIFIIMLSFIAVRYLTSEYASKIKAYKRYAREQEVLEKISSNFISVNRENAKEKVDEMLEASVEILGFDRAYLIAFSADCEDASVFNTYIKDVEIELFSYHPGMQVKIETLPLAKLLMAQNQPLICEDIASLPIDEEEKYFFTSRGVASFLALPIIVDEELTGMLVAEYDGRIVASDKENLLYFLQMIANILGDTKKKTTYEEKLYNFAYFDETTKLADRNMLMNYLEQILDNRKESERIAVFDIERDNLGMINDTFGHSAGEQIVIKTAAILQNLVKDCCIIARAAEGKFIAVLPKVENTKQIEEYAKAIRESFLNPILPEEGIEALFVIVSVGISVYPDDGRDADTLLKNADLAGGEAKTTDHKIVFFSEELRNRITENTLLTNKLFRSLQNGEFSLAFQPQISCKTGKTAGVEALLRWTTSDNEKIPPDTFVPILEQTGLIHDVGHWVLEQTLREHNRLVEKGLPPIRFSVNLSVVQFRKQDFVLDVSKLIEASQVDPKYIELEITESMLSEKFPDTVKKLFELKELGINITIDDFGRGYSSLYRLESIPFSRIKIDKSIVDEVPLKEKKTVIAKAIVSLAKTLMAEITAKGVETKEQVDFLKNIACDEIQGYYFSRPLSAEALEEFLRKEVPRTF